MAMFHLLNIRTSIDIFKYEKCKVTFGLEYRIKRSLNLYLVLYVKRHVNQTFVSSVSA